MPRTDDTPRFSDRLVEAIRAAGAPACVGLDPVVERLPGAVRADEPAAAVGAFCRGVLEAVVGVVPVVKFQSACFERLGGAGFDLLAELSARARELGLLTLLDAKRGDIGISAGHYAASAVRLNADAITVNAYLGPSTVEPYLKAGLGVFVLVRTSNEDSNAVQSLSLADDRTVAQMMADLAASLAEGRVGRHGYSDVGAVVAAGAPAGEDLRWRMPGQFFLVPGYGAQGGAVEDIRPLLDDDVGGVLVTASRSVIYAFDARSDDWAGQVRAAAEGFVGELAGLRG
jgi:orotidine-5'-phosphate decarboxylase